MKLETIGVGGGCHWCTEAVFTALQGVQTVQQGFIKSVPPHDNFSEAVIVEYDPEVIPLNVIIDIHLRTHAATSNHTMREKYRSAIYTYSNEQSENVDQILTQLQSHFDKKIITQTLPFGAFRSSDEKYQNYGVKNSGGQFCKTYIDPKLSMLRVKYSKRVKN